MASYQSLQDNQIQQQVPDYLRGQDQDVYQPPPLYPEVQAQANQGYPQYVQGKSQTQDQQPAQTFQPFQDDEQNKAPSAPPKNLFGVYDPQKASSYRCKSKKEAEGCWAGFKSDPYKCNLICSIGIYISIFLLLLAGIGILDDDYFNTFIGVFCFFYLIYICECFCCSTYKYLSNIYNEAGAQQYLDNLRKEAPYVEWIVQCYHYETHTTFYTDKNGVPRTRTRTTRINTHYAKTYFEYEGWKDISPPSDQLGEYKITRVDLEKKLMFADAKTQKIYDKKLQKFKKRHWWDQYQEFTMNLVIKGFRDKILAVTEGTQLPCGMNKGVYILCSIFLVNVFYRMWFNSITGDFDMYILKEIIRRTKKYKKAPSSSDSPDTP